MADQVLCTTRHLRLIDRDGWFFVERPNASGVVIIVAVTDDRRLLLVEQHRPALGGKVLELPAGLAGDAAAHEGEKLEMAARRELLEETGWEADQMVELVSCATAPGLSNEVITFFRATGLRQVGAGGGVDQEDIQVHAIPLPEVTAFAAARAAQGTIPGLLIYAGLHFATMAR
jgi:ADP-ribose pyrophosphatase